MSYSIDFRKRTIEYRNEGHSLRDTSKIFKVSVSTLRDWEKLYKETGSLQPRELHRTYKKVDPQKLKTFIKEYPDAYLQEIANEFGCSKSAIRKTLQKLKITRKKNDTLL